MAINVFSGGEVGRTERSDPGQSGTYLIGPCKGCPGKGGSGIARVKGIKGRTIVWNQLAPQEWKRIEVTDNVVHEIGTISKGRKYFISYFLEITEKNKDKFLGMCAKLGPHGSGVWAWDVSAARDYYFSGVVESKDDRNNQLQLITSGPGVVVVFRDVQFIDLTLMFGAGNEPSTPEEFRDMFPLNWYDHCEGDLLSVQEKEVRFHQLLDWSRMSVNSGHIGIGNGDKFRWVAGQNFCMYCGQELCRPKPGHTYILLGKFRNNNNIKSNKFACGFSSSKWEEQYVELTPGQIIDVEFYFRNIAEDDTTYKFWPRFYFPDGINRVVLFKDIQLFDLTEIFGPGNEPLSVSEFKAIFPDLPYVSTPEPVKKKLPLILQATGSNIIEPGELIRTTGNLTSAYIPSGEDYLVSAEISQTPVPLKVKISPRDRDIYASEISRSQQKAIISVERKDKSQNFVQLYKGDNVPTDQQWDNIVRCGELKKLRITREKSVSSVSPYFPKTTSTTKMHIPEIFPNGLCSVGQVCDEISNGLVTKRIGSVDLGTLNYIKHTGTLNSSVSYYSCPNTYGAWSDSESHNLGNQFIVSGVRYRQGSAEKVYQGSCPDKTISMSVGGEFRIRDDKYTTPEALKSALSGTIVYYILKTPSRSRIPWDIKYRFNSAGIEEVLPRSGATPHMVPTQAFIEYQKKLVGYTRTEYLENSGTAYIDTGYKPGPNTKLEFDINYSKRVNFCYLFGTRSPHFSASFQFNYVKVYYGTSISSEILLTIKGEDRRSFLFYQGALYCDGQLVNSTQSADFKCQYNLFLFNGNPGGNNVINDHFRGKFYGCRIYESGTLVRDFIPVFRDSDGKLGMYEELSGKFYISPNGSNFEAT